MKKITQNFINIKVWQSIMVAFVFLFSLTTFSQTCPTDKLDTVVVNQLGENITIQATSLSKSVTSTIPYLEGLESGTQGELGTAELANTEYGWTIATGHFTHGIGNDGLQGWGGDNYLRHDNYVASGEMENWVLTPTFDLSGAATPELNYWDHAHQQDAAAGVSHEVLYSTNYVDNGSTEDTSDVTAATWVLLTDAITDNINYEQYYSGCGCNPENTWDEGTFSLPSEAAVTVAFKYTGNNSSDWLVDDISVMDTSAPAADWSVSVDFDDATVSVVSLTNFTVGNGGGYDGHWHYTLDGGSANMVYNTSDVSLTGLANGEHTLVAWLVDNNHTALDPAIEETITFSTFDGIYPGGYPYCSSFDTDLGYWETSIYSGEVDWVGGTTANGSGSVTPLTGAGMAFFYSNNYNYDTASIISPSMDLTGLTNPKVTFNYTQQSWAGDQDELRVFYRDGANGTWVELAAYTSEVITWTEVTLELPNTSADYYVGFQGTSGYGYGVTVDDVCIWDGTAIDADWDVSVTDADATISISVDNFTIGAAGGGYDGHWHYTVDGGSEVMVYDTNDVALTGLANGEHTLVVWLTDDNHQALDPPIGETITFSTHDGMATIPWSDDFETGDFSVGWTSSEAAGAPSSLWETGQYVNNTSGGSWSAQHPFSTAGVHDSYLISPTFDLSGSSDVVVSYSEYIEWATWADTHSVLYSEDYSGDVDTATWVVLNEFIGSNWSGGNTITWTDNGPYALPTTGTTVNIAFRYTGYDGSNWFIDDVSIEENTMSIDDEDTLDMKIYPNPVDGNFVTILSPVNGTKYIQVFDIMGKRVMDTTINNNTLDVSSINSGFYMIKVTINGQSKISKLVVR